MQIVRMFPRCGKLYCQIVPLNSEFDVTWDLTRTLVNTSRTIMRNDRNLCVFERILYENFKLLFKVIIILA